MLQACRRWRLVLRVARRVSLPRVGRPRVLIHDAAVAAGVERPEAGDSTHAVDDVAIHSLARRRAAERTGRDGDGGNGHGRRVQKKISPAPAPSPNLAASPELKRSETELTVTS